ncbi:hypothetical protein SZN_04501 [Streptomyces zinciresistens K42]|uniref:Uncharacterized protein n=1 Tax=Streptomyces zinciresistens K42 TaxID=700597 RepID=G2G5Z4_9ACTN|nr:hypothetical protein SZN_04501 [Streptomyces zinciresistens K42]
MGRTAGAVALYGLSVAILVAVARSGTPLPQG